MLIVCCCCCVNIEDDERVGEINEIMKMGVGVGRLIWLQGGGGGDLNGDKYGEMVIFIFIIVSIVHMGKGVMDLGV